MKRYFMIKSDPEKTVDFIWIMFVCIGGIFLIIGLIVVGNIFNYENTSETTAIITEISSHGSKDHEVYVSYAVGGREYESRLNRYSSDFYEGKKIDIYYDRDDPQKIGMKSLDLLFLMFPGFGLVFLIIGGTGIAVRVCRKKTEKKLRENGNLIYANYVETVLNGRYTVNRTQHPYNVICEWNNPEDGKKYRLKSKNIWVNPERMINEKNIKTFSVYMDPENKKRYFIDVDFLTEDTTDLI